MLEFLVLLIKVLSTAVPEPFAIRAGKLTVYKKN
jgi:hypothetical protein